MKLVISDKEKLLEQVEIMKDINWSQSYHFSKVTLEKSVEVVGEVALRLTSNHTGDFGERFRFSIE